jgi:parallel beta-helix repeat protein
MFREMPPWATGTNVISGNLGNGIQLSAATRNTILDNRIGTDTSGTLKVSNRLDGIRLSASSNNSISDNLISGNSGNGIELVNSSESNAITTNQIGVASGGVSLLGNGGYGVFVQDNSSGNSIGGASNEMGNTIAGNLTGVVVGNNPTTDNSTGDRILGNSIYANSDLGIDLGDDGVTPNKDPEPTVGPNRLQNYPVLTSAMTSGTSLTIAGTLNSAASMTYRIEFFAQAAGDPSGYGQGQTYLGFATVTTGANRNAVINVTLRRVNVPAGQVITTTATSPNGNTSEYSLGITVT